MVLTFHGRPLASGQRLCDIDKVYFRRNGITPIFSKIGDWNHRSNFAVPERSIY